jgi:hypothetical protein
VGVRAVLAVKTQSDAYFPGNSRAFLAALMHWHAVLADDDLVFLRLWKTQVRRSGGFHVSLAIGEEALTSAVLSEHAAISIAFVVDRVLEVRLRDGA